MLRYNTTFHQYVTNAARASASIMVPAVYSLLRPESVLDVGCGHGSWCREWAVAGAKDVWGIDGGYVDLGALQMPANCFVAADLTKPFDLGRSFDLVTCLEVAEHIPEAAANILLDSLCRHGDVVIFSAAVIGQGGTNHVNEQPLVYWVNKFAGKGYQLYDAVRPLVACQADVKPWYRFNTLLFASDTGVRRLPEMVLQSIVPKSCAPQDILPLTWKLRCFMISLLPVPVVTLMSQTKNRILVSVRAQRRTIG